MSQTVGPILEAVAKARQVITYKDLSSRCGLPEHKGDWKSHPLSSIFESLDQDDANQNRPFRTSVVVRSDLSKQMPGDGFFEALERLKGIISLNATARERTWIKELTDAHNYPCP